MAFINRNFIIDKLLPNVSIEKLIGQYVEVKKKGNSYWCCCPFHHEKTPSCCITPSKQMFYCFGCKEHGNAIDFLMKLKNLSFVEAVEDIAQYAGIQIEYDKSNQSKEQMDKQALYYELMDRVASYFTKVLHSDEGKVGFEYFDKIRGLSSETILKARLGFAPNSFDYVQKHICKNQAEIDMLVDLGVLVRNERGVHAMYRNRVMIPIFDKRGRVISFGGRTMGNDKPKYLNTKESPVYRKRQELFGLFEALKLNNNRPSRVVIVEGYMDVISVRQAGCSYAVASLGTATTPEQINTLFRYTDKVIFCYDGDDAGRNAAWHALGVVTPLMQETKDLRFVFLPKEHDPDSLVRAYGVEGFTKYLDEAMSYPEFLISHQISHYNIQDPGQLAVFIQESLKLIKQIPVSAVQSVAIKLLAGPSGISESQLYDMFKSQKDESKKITTEFSKEFDAKLNEGGRDKILTTPMRRLIAFAVQNPNIISSYYNEFALDNFVALCKQSKTQGYEQLSEIFRIISDNPNLNQANLVEYVRQTPLEKMVKLLMQAQLHTSFEGSGEISLEKKIDYLANLLTEVLVKSLREIGNSLKIKVSQGDPKSVMLFQSIQQNLNQLDKK